MLTKFKNFYFQKYFFKYSLARLNSTRSIDYEIVDIPEKDRDKVWDFLKINYFPDEPFSKAFGGAPTEDDFKNATSLINNGLSRIAVEKKTNTLLGVTLNEIYTKEYSDSLTSIIKDESLSKSERHWLTLCKKLDEESKFWERIGVNTCLRNAVICIDRNYRGLKIAKNLLESTKTVSNERYLRGESTQFSSYEILKSQGWETIYEINLQDYRDENNQVIIKTEPPNGKLRLLIYKTEK